MFTFNEMSTLGLLSQNDTLLKKKGDVLKLMQNLQTIDSESAVGVSKGSPHSTPCLL